MDSFTALLLNPKLSVWPQRRPLITVLQLNTSLVPNLTSGLVINIQRWNSIGFN